MVVDICVCQCRHTKRNRQLFLFPDYRQMVRCGTANYGKQKTLQIAVMTEWKMKQQFSCLFHFIQERVCLVRSLQYSFHIYREITEVVMTQFIAQLLWFPAELACSLRVTIQLLQNSVWYFIFSNHYLAFFFVL